MRVMVLNRGGKMPSIDPVNSEAYVSMEEIKKKADNPEVANKYGANFMVIAVEKNHWHIVQVSGYNRFDGRFCEVY